MSIAQKLINGTDALLKGRQLHVFTPFKKIKAYFDTKKAVAQKFEEDRAGGSTFFEETFKKAHEQEKERLKVAGSKVLSYFLILLACLLIWNIVASFINHKIHLAFWSLIILGIKFIGLLILSAFATTCFQQIYNAYLLALQTAEVEEEKALQNEVESFKIEEDDPYCNVEMGEDGFIFYSVDID